MKDLTCTETKRFLNRKRISSFLSFVILFAFIVIFTHCHKEGDWITLSDYTPQEPSEFNETSEANSHDSTKLNNFNETLGAEQTGYYYCKTITHSLSENPAAFVASDPLEGIVLPGLLVKGSSVFKGIPSIIPIADQRKKINVFLSVASGTGGPVFLEVNPVQSEITQAINTILASYSGGFPARYEFESKLITSQEQLEAEMKVGWSSPTNKLAVKAGFNYDQNKTSMLVTLTQSFFTFGVDALSESNTFSDGKTPQEIESYLKPEADGTPNPLAYISSVTYGRVYKFYMTINEKNFDLKAAVDYAYSGATNNISVKAKTALQKRLSEVKTVVYQIGGDAASGLATAFLKHPATDLDSIRNFIVGGANFSNTNVGAPISFSVRALKDNKLLKITNLLSWEEKVYVPYPNPNDTVKVIDIDGNIYPVVHIGTQFWMGENLRTTRLNNGDTIYHKSIISDFTATPNPAYCGSENSNYGLLYNWYTVAKSNVCPIGWHIPYNDEFSTLSDYLGGSGVAGQKLKASGLIYWSTGNTGTNSSHFNAKGSGVISLEYNTMEYIGEQAYWWTTDRSSVYSPAWYVTYNSNAFYTKSDFKHTYGFSLRCLKD